ncbi:hypothetical protein EXIGLDRAFT_720923 [Exidia glandulosa HHB12029]|uniref:Uncharacterized protein n=1 Tax=Exidia glandulosa HHB12029 TaxID=1314781 RepID=A0A165NFZ7_EXIGL|nr:hypothetical protein EXIGLDRAFT_720923 [Exidia glandulosa HHB12029]
MPSVDLALCSEYQEKWSTGARRRRRSSSSASRESGVPLGNRISMDLVRVDELPSTSALDDQEESDDCHLFPLPCGKRKTKSRAGDAMLSGSEDDQSGSGSLTPQSSDEACPTNGTALSIVRDCSTPSLTPTSEYDELPLPSPTLSTLRTPPPPLFIPIADSKPLTIEPVMVPVIREPMSVSPTSSPSSSPVRTRLLSASASFIRGAVAAAATPSASAGTGIGYR